MGERLACYTRYFENKLVTFQHFQAGPEFSSVMMGLLLALNICWDPSSPRPQMENIYDPSLKMLRDNLYCSCKYPVLLCFTLTRDESDQNQSNAAVSGLRTHLPCHDRVKKKNVYAVLSMMSYFPPQKTFPTEVTWQGLRSSISISTSFRYKYFHGKCSEEIHSLVPSLQQRPIMTGTLGRIILIPYVSH